MAGQVAGQIKEIKPIAEIFEDMWQGAKSALESCNL
jgi:NAD(P)H-dependent flavin oxidoreductase YrpB (nitropropane dioxygenase family)